jgi:hypothetical protein
MGPDLLACDIQGFRCFWRNEKIALQLNLTLGYNYVMTRASKAAKQMAKLSVAARRLKWGEEGFRAKMRLWGKLGGRPRNDKGSTNAD